MESTRTDTQYQMPSHDRISNGLPVYPPGNEETCYGEQEFHLLCGLTLVRRVRGATAVTHGQAPMKTRHLQSGIPITQQPGETIKPGAFPISIATDDVERSVIYARNDPSVAAERA